MLAMLIARFAPLLGAVLLPFALQAPGAGAPQVTIINPPGGSAEQTADATSIASATLPVAYTEAQVATILGRAHAAYDGYRAVRSRLRAHDSREQAFAQRATAFQHRLHAVERLIADEKKKPTYGGQQAIGEALTWLDRGALLVEYDLQRVRLRAAQEAVAPNRSFGVVLAPGGARQSPTGAIAWPPAGEVALALAAGEAESFQIVIIPFWEPLTGVKVAVSDLYHEEALDRIAASRIQTWLVETVITSQTVGREVLCADPLTPARPFDVPATATQAVLIDLRAHPHQAAGPYEGAITITAEGALEPIKLPLHVTVWDFSIAEAMPAVAFWAQNDYLQASFAGEQPTQFIRDWQAFLAPFGLRLYRPQTTTDSATGWSGWHTAAPMPGAGLTGRDPFALEMPTAIEYRRVGWARWAQEGIVPPAAGPQWLVRGWITIDAAGYRPGDPPAAPLVRQGRPAEGPVEPPGLVYLTRASQPQPTVSLLALRDGIEDYAYCRSLARCLAKARQDGSAGWFTRRRWGKLLDLAPALTDLQRPVADGGALLAERRAAIARALEEAHAPED